MPTINDRNAEASAMQATDFPQRQDHFTGVNNLATLIRWAPAIVNGWLLSPISINASSVPYYPGIVGNFAWTSTVNTCAGLSPSPGANVIFRHGLIGNARLGEVNQRALFTSGTPNNSRTYAEGWSSTQGLWTMIGLFLPPTAVAPNAGATTKVWFSKFRFDSNAANYSFSWELDWRFTGGNTYVATQLSNTGNSSVNFYANPNNVTPGNFYILGFIYTPGVSVTTFVNTDFRTAIAPDSIFNGHPNVVPASLNTASNVPVCLARWQTTTAGFSSYPSADAYYYFAMFGHAALTIGQWLSMYHLIKPALGYNTDLGGV